MRKQKFPNQTVERLTALRGILNMHERAIKKGKACKLNGQSRKFNMGTWDCGTAACALGSAALNPWFKERGLHMDKNLGCPVHDNWEDFEAGESFFGITNDESYNLFSVSQYEVEADDEVTPAMVRDRVDALIKKYSGETNA